MSGLRRFVVFGLALLGSSAPVFSQLRTPIQGEVELGGLVSSATATPFWLRTNQYGIIPTQAPAGIVQAAVQKAYRQPDSTRNRSVDWSFRINPVLTADRQDRLKLTLVEANFGVRFKAVELYAGRRRQVTGLGDTTLTSGFYAVSGNALPMPKLQLATVGYAPLHFTGDFVAINAGLAHGWYRMASLEGVRLHQKYAYFRLGKPASRLKGYVGLNHQVQWAGHADYLKQRPDIADAAGYFPSDWKFYQYVLFSYTPKNWADVAGYTSFDSYRVGNSLGSIDAGLELNLASGRWLVYHQHAYDDVSGIVFKNVPDGLWGINFVPIPARESGFGIDRVTAELLTTTNQSGSTFYIPGTSYQGGDNYFNHGQYAEGWSYFGRTVGTPFIAPRQDFAPSSPLANGPSFSNNRVTMGYLGAQASYQRTVFTLRVSYSRNHGTFSQPLTQSMSQFSGLLTAQRPVPRLANSLLVVKLALDNGGLFTNAVGGYLGVKKTW